jgi:glycosyltransferase involved in cell wall biosynthesis
MKRKPRVGIFTYDFFPIIGGQGRFLYELYRQNIKKNKIDLYFFSPSKSNLKNHIQIFPETLNSKLKNLEYSAKLHWEIEDLIDKYKLDIVHFQGGPGGLFFLKRVKIPLVFTSHHTYWQQSHYINEQKWKKILYYFERSSFQKADLVICDCESTENVLLNYYGIPKGKMTVLPIGIDLAKFKPNKHINNTKELLYVGRIDKRKGLEFLIKTMTIINKVDPNIRLHIVGRGKDKEKLEQFSKENNLNIVFHGSISDEQLEKLYESISVQIVPSIFEGFGLSVLEGMAKKVPIIATNVDAIKDIIEDNKNGILVEYGNSEELTDSVLKLIKNKKLANSLVSNAYSEFKRYDWKDIYRDTLNIYENLA